MNDTTRFEQLIEDVCPSLPVCNCASCGKLLVSEEVKERNRHHSRNIDTVFVRARGVPFCKGCSSHNEIGFILRGRQRRPGAASG